MAALVQSYPLPSGGVTMLQARNSSTVPLHSSQSSQLGPQFINRMPLYRPNTAPIKPYAFTSTPSLNRIGAHDSQANDMPRNAQVHASRSLASWESAYTSTVRLSPSGSRDDSFILPQRPALQNPRPHSAYMARSASPQIAAPAKNTPDRYRRPSSQGSVLSAPQLTSGQASIGKAALPDHLVNASPSREVIAAQAAGHVIPHQTVIGSAADDIKLCGDLSPPPENQRLRRRSMHSLNCTDYPEPLTGQLSCSHLVTSVAPAPLQRDESRSLYSAKTPVTNMADSDVAVDASKPLRNVSAESAVSAGSYVSRCSTLAKSQNPPTTAPHHSSTSSVACSVRPVNPRVVSSIALRASEAVRRVVNPSPLSRSAMIDCQVDSPSSPSSASATNTHSTDTTAKTSESGDSPAMKQLAAFGQTPSNKPNSKTARLRRALSFGSASDFRKASSAHEAKGESYDQFDSAQASSNFDQYNAEQAAIAQRQEEGGIGNNIYGARLFSGSTDNLSISSTASSASIMIRKMGRGVKRSTRSLVGIFRPKSIVGAPIPEAIQPHISGAAVSMIHVEAEKPARNEQIASAVVEGPRIVFLKHQEQPDESTEWAPLQATEDTYSPVADAPQLSALVNVDVCRAQVLASVRKGILKRTCSNPTLRTADLTHLPLIGGNGPARLYEVSSPTAPTLSLDVSQGHKRIESASTLELKEYVAAAVKLRQDTRSAPVGTSQCPHTPTKRNATFSPRIIFHDTWPSQEYDRRGELATCNRLTPILAQQIKEELNTFKMEMEVHENSKIYTHFF